MKKIVIIGANEFQNPLILKAKEMGFETHVFAWRDGAVGEKSADFFYPISIVEKEKILEQCKKIKPDAVTTIASDLAEITVNYLSNEMGLLANSNKCIVASTNKYEMRKTFDDAGVAVPRFCYADLETDLSTIRDAMNLPVIVKPTDRSGSRAITKLDNWDGLGQAIEGAVSESFEKKAIIEEYLEGEEYSCECISFKGVHHFLAITKKFTTGNPHYIEIGHLQPSMLDDSVIERVKQVVFKALDALDIKNGASHSEFKVDKNGKVSIIEIGSRMGGDCIGSDLVPISTGYDFMKMVIQVAMGEKPDLASKSNMKVAAIRFILSKEDFSHYCMLLERYPEKIYRTSKINIVHEQDVVDSSSRYGFYILKCDSTEEAMELAQL